MWRIFFLSHWSRFLSTFIYFIAAAFRMIHTNRDTAFKSGEYEGISRPNPISSHVLIHFRRAILILIDNISIYRHSLRPPLNQQISCYPSENAAILIIFQNFWYTIRFDTSLYPPCYSQIVNVSQSMSNFGAMITRNISSEKTTIIDGIQLMCGVRIVIGLLSEFRYEWNFKRFFFSLLSCNVTDVFIIVERESALAFAIVSRIISYFLFIFLLSFCSFDSYTLLLSVFHIVHEWALSARACAHTRLWNVAVKFESC